MRRHERRCGQAESEGCVSIEPYTTLVCLAFLAQPCSRHPEKLVNPYTGCPLCKATPPGIRAQRPLTSV